MEIWKRINGYPNYEISTLGNVKSYACGRDKLLLKIKGSNGYYFVNLSNKGKAYPINIHRLVAENFIPNQNDTLQVNHINGVKTDNRIENLEWVTLSENIKHAYRTGIFKNRGEFHKMSKLNREDVNEIKKLLLSTLSQKKIAAIFNVDQAVISNIKLNKSY
jgi:hypothetical protein